MLYDDERIREMARLKAALAVAAAEIARLTAENEALHATLSARAEKWTDETIKSALDGCEQFADIAAMVFKMRDDFAAEVERLTAENAALRSELSDWRRWGPAPDWIDLPDPDENDEIELPEGYAIFKRVDTHPIDP